MTALGRRRVWIGAIVGIVLCVGVGLVGLALRADDDNVSIPIGQSGGLVVQTGRDDDVKLDEKRPLRCFVNGQFAGEITLSDCAKRNGVAKGAMDVGLDASGALAASGAGGPITPMPPSSAAGTSGGDTASRDLAQAASTSDASAACWRVDSGQWTRVGDAMGLEECVMAIAPDPCEPLPAGPLGRWGARTLRSMKGRVGILGPHGVFQDARREAPACDAPPSE